MKKDIAAKRLEEYSDVFVDIYNNLFFDGEKILQEDNLDERKNEGYYQGVDGKNHENRGDVRMVDKKQNEYRLVYALENQAQTDYTMPERVMGYNYTAYEAQIRKIEAKNSENEKAKEKKKGYVQRLRAGQKLAPVITGVLNWGGGEWQGPSCLHDMLKFPEEKSEQIKRLAPDYPMNLVNVSKIPKEVRDRMTSDFRWIAEFMANRKNPKKLRQVFAESNQRLKHPEAVLDMLTAITKDDRYTQLKKIFEEEETKEEIKVCEFFDYMVNEGLERGREEGLERGRKEGFEILNKLNTRLIADNRVDDLKRAVEDPVYQKQLMLEYRLA